MTAWKEIGLALRDNGRAEFVKVHGESPRLNMDQVEPFSEPLNDAMILLRDTGDLSGIIAILRSDYPLKREILADKFEEVEQEKKWRKEDHHQGPQRDEDVWSVVVLCEDFYRDWCDINKRLGINDRGVRKQMRYLSCKYAQEVEHVEGEKVYDPEELVEKMLRPKNRRPKNVASRDYYNVEQIEAWLEKIRRTYWGATEDELPPK
jgi:hypothetical protein